MKNYCLLFSVAVLVSGISRPQNASGVSIITSVKLAEDRYFYLEVQPGSKHATLMQRKLSQPKARQLLDPNSITPGGKTASIIDIEPSGDGKYVALGIQDDVTKNKVIRIVQVSKAKLLEDSIPGTVDGAATWADDSHSFYYRAFQSFSAGSPPSARFDNMRAYRHRLGDDPRSDKPVFGPEIAPELKLPVTGFVNAFPIPGTSLELAVQSSAPTELDSFWERDLADQVPKWRQIVDHKDRVLFEFATHATTFFYVTLSHAPNGRVMAFDAAKEDVANARVILPESSINLADRDACGVAAAQDALYIYGIRNGQPVVVRLQYDDPDTREEIPLPPGTVLTDVGADSRVPGLVFTLSRADQPAAFYQYDPKVKKSLPVNLR